MVYAETRRLEFFGKENDPPTFPEKLAERSLSLDFVRTTAISAVGTATLPLATPTALRILNNSQKTEDNECYSSQDIPRKEAQGAAMFFGGIGGAYAAAHIYGMAAQAAIENGREEYLAIPLVATSLSLAYELSRKIVQRIRGQTIDKILF